MTSHRPGKKSDVLRTVCAFGWRFLNRMDTDNQHKWLGRLHSLFFFMSLSKWLWCSLLSNSNPLGPFSLLSGLGSSRHPPPPPSQVNTPVNFILLQTVTRVFLKSPRFFFGICSESIDDSIICDIYRCTAVHWILSKCPRKRDSSSLQAALRSEFENLGKIHSKVSNYCIF